MASNSYFGGARTFLSAASAEMSKCPGMVVACCGMAAGN